MIGQSLVTYNAMEVVVPNAVNKGDKFQVALAYAIDHDGMSMPDVGDVSVVEFKEMQGPVCLTHQHGVQHTSA